MITSPLIYSILCSIFVTISALPSKKNITTRIVGGSPTTIESFKYQVSLLYKNYHMCGGSIISERYVLTAAHCVANTNKKNFKVRAGSTDWDRGGIVAKVNKIIQHGKYNPRTQNNDIALLQITGSYKKYIDNNVVNKIALPQHEPRSPVSLIVTGWGTVSFGSSKAPERLRKVTVQFIPFDECNKLYGNILTDSMVCAGTMKGGKDACQGDSGGPLALEDGKAQVGVVSFGDGCGNPDKPGVYTNVAHFVKWIAWATSTYS